MNHKTLITFHFSIICLILPDFASSKLTISIPYGRVPMLQVLCGNTNSLLMSNNVTIDCKYDFWNQTASVELANRFVNFKAEKVAFYQGTKSYEQYFVKSFRKAIFYYTLPVGSNYVTWNLTVNTSAFSTDVAGRIYFLTDCTNTKSLISLATSFQNFGPGMSDYFSLNVSDNPNENFCVGFWDTVDENWKVDSIKLEKPGFSEVIYYRGHLFNRHFYRYAGPNAFEWIVTLGTGQNGADVGIDIIFNGYSCSTIITLDNENVNFVPNRQDTFHIKTKNCNPLKSIQIRCQRQCNWILVNSKITSKDGSLIYTHRHDATVVGTLTIYKANNDNQQNNTWHIFTCSTTSTNEAVKLQLFGDLDTSEAKILDSPRNDFEAGECSNFTVFYKDIGNLQSILLEKPTSLVISKLLISNENISYPFHLVAENGSSYKLVAYRTGILRHNLDDKYAEIDLQDAFTLVSVHVEKNVTFEIQVGNNNKTWESCFMNEQKACTQPVTGQYVKFNGTSAPGEIKLELRPTEGRKIWFLNINFGQSINTVYIRLEDNNLSTIVSYFLTKKMNSVSIDLYTDDKLFNNTDKLILETDPALKTCANVVVEIIQVTSDEIASYFTTTKQTSCEWNITLIIHPTTTHLGNTTWLSTFTDIPVITNDAATEENSVTNTSGTMTILKTNTTESHPTGTDANTVEMLTSFAMETSTSHGHANTTKWCPCPCVKVLTAAEFENRLKKLTKELKVNRNETTSYLRSKISAPDDRPSSQIIGSTAVIIMVVPFGLIILIDLLPLLSFIYRKIRSFM